EAPRGGGHGGVPRWWKSRFVADDSEAPIILDLAGMTKGQIYVGGRHLGRDFVATAGGAAGPPPTRDVGPRSVVGRRAAAEVMLFDERGAGPGKVKLSS